MDRVQKAQNVIDNFKPSEKLANNVVLTKYEDNGKTIYTFTPIVEWDEDINVATNYDPWQLNFIGFGVSAKMSKHHRKEINYCLKPSQNSYILVHKKTKEGRIFKKLNKSYWFVNRENAKKGKGIISYPQAYEDNGEFKFDGKIIEIELNEKDIVDTLEKAGLITDLKHKIYRGEIWNYEYGYSSVWSYWDTDEGCFVADAYRPSGRLSWGAAAFEETKEKPEVLKREILEREYQALLKDSKELKEMKPIVNDYKTKLETVRRTVA